jgi:hypothetical protein
MSVFNIGVQMQLFFMYVELCDGVFYHAPSGVRCSFLWDGQSCVLGKRVTWLSMIRARSRVFAMFADLMDGWMDQGFSDDERRPRG